MNGSLLLILVFACATRSSPLAEPGPETLEVATPQAPEATPEAPPEGPLAWSQLRADRAEASSFLRSNWNKYNENYHPNYVLDGDPKTAWVEGATGNGEGETLTIPLSTLRTAKRVKLRVRNGYQKSPGLLVANAAPKQVTVSAHHRNQVVGQQATALERNEGWQEIMIDLNDGAGLDAVRLQVDSVHPGDRYKDTCISDIEVFVESTVPYNATQENKHHEALMTWVKERVATAQYFATKPVDYPFTGNQYDSDRSDTTVQQAESRLTEARAALAALRDAGPWYNRAIARKLPAFPDGLQFEDALLPLFSPSEVSFFEADKAVSKHTTEEDEMWSAEMWDSNARIEWAAPNRPRAIYFWTKVIEHGRGTYEAKTEYVVHYTDAGTVDWVYSSTGSDGADMGPFQIERLHTFQSDGAKVTPQQQLSVETHGTEQADSFAYILQYRG